MAESDYKFEEWKELRNEINWKSQLNNRIIFSTYTLNLLLYAFVLDKEQASEIDPIIVMLPIFVVGLGHFWHLKNQHSVLRITLYLRHFLEDPNPNPDSNGFKWESTLKYITSRIKKVREERSDVEKKKKNRENKEKGWKHKREKYSLLGKTSAITKNLFIGIVNKGLKKKLQKVKIAKTERNPPREVNMLFNSFYLVSPVVAMLITHIDSKPETGSFFKNLPTFFQWFWPLIISLGLFLIFKYTLVNMMKREIDILNFISDEIAENGTGKWLDRIEKEKTQENFVATQPA